MLILSCIINVQSLTSTRRFIMKRHDPKIKNVLIFSYICLSKIKINKSYINNKTCSKLLMPKICI